MKKKIKDLTFSQRENICNKYIFKNCHLCPFYAGEDDTGEPICKDIIGGYGEDEVEVDDRRTN